MRMWVVVQKEKKKLDMTFSEISKKKKTIIYIFKEQALPGFTNPVYATKSQREMTNTLETCFLSKGQPH